MAGDKSSPISTEGPQISHLTLTGQFSRWAGGAGGMGSKVAVLLLSRRFDGFLTTGQGTQDHFIQPSASGQKSN